tara:strand:+ start:443 stop:652 length:210 start_codon:yes stop_codon:yes gene_type:complete
MDKKSLETLHNKLAEDLLLRIESGEASSAELNVARQFLKDNGIDSSLQQDNPLINLAKTLPFDQNIKTG